MRKSNLEKWVDMHIDMIKGAFSTIDEDEPDGAWLQIHYDIMLKLLEEDDLLCDENDANDATIYFLEKEGE